MKKSMFMVDIILYLKLQTCYDNDDDDDDDNDLFYRYSQTITIAMIRCELQRQFAHNVILNLNSMVQVRANLADFDSYFILDLVFHFSYRPLFLKIFFKYQLIFRFLLFQSI
ncbi:Hypothetical_protein [Hexamita inflata]|uniref:Hypothetical_protein n=1 Tax=Hexamita inflata TaxID=28002 RepID=A0ABP1LLF5_9EUKA